MKTRRLISLLLLLFALVLCFASCTGDTDSTVDVKDPVYKAGETVELNVYNWGEYISDGSEGSYNTNKEFEKFFNTYLSEKYGGVKVKVNYSTYATNEDMYSKLKNSAASYDIVIPSDYMIEKMIDEGMLLKFNVEEDIDNYSYIIDNFKNPYYDERAEYSVPYTYGMMGIIYNKTVVPEEDIAEKSWSLLWNERYKGQILQFNNPRDAFATAMYWKGMDVNSTDPEVWDEALRVLKEQKPLLQGYVSDEIFDKMRGESAAIAPYFVGDFLTMANQESNLGFYYPKEGVNYFVDAMCIPITTKHPSIAKEYINFMLSEQAAIANAEYIGYASPNSVVQKSEEYKESMAEWEYVGENGENAYDLLYNLDPNDVNEAYNALFPDKASPACYRNFDKTIQTRVNTLWEDLKISGSTELWVHITSIAIVVIVIVLAAYDIYVKKKRSRDYRIRDKERMLEKKKQA